MTPQFRALEPHEQPACLQLWTQVFSPGADYFVRYFEEPLWKPEYTRVCEVDGRLVSAVQIVRRAVRLNGQAVPMAGIANVATLPEYRGRGFSTQLMRDAQRVMDAEDFLFGLLFTGIHDFYARLGWERVPFPLWSATPQPLALDGWRFRTAEPDDLPRVQVWYAQSYADHPLSVVRDDAYWRIWTRWDDPNWRRAFYIAEDSLTARGYVVLETHHRTLPDGTRRVSTISVQEVGAAPNDTEAFQKLIGFAIQMAVSAEAEAIRFFLPRSDVERWVRPFLPDVAPQPMGSAMVRVGVPERLWEAFEPFGAQARTAAQKLPPALALAWLFGLELPEIPDELYTLLPPRPACYSPVDSF